MYKHAHVVLLALTLVAVLMVPAAQAQTITLKADIPFDFVVGEKRLPQGEYLVKPFSPTATMIQSNDTRSSAIVLTSAVSAPKAMDVGKLVFNRYGDQYFLSRIWEPASNLGRGVAKSHLESEVAKAMANPPTNVAVRIQK